MDTLRPVHVRKLLHAIKWHHLRLDVESVSIFPIVNSGCALGEYEYYLVILYERHGLSDHAGSTSKRLRRHGNSCRRSVYKYDPVSISFIFKKTFLPFPVTRLYVLLVVIICIPALHPFSFQAASPILQQVLDRRTSISCLLSKVS